MKKKNLIVGAMIVGTVLLSSFTFYAWQIIYTPNILIEKDDQLFKIPKGADFKTVQNALYDQEIVNDLVSFSFLAKLKKYDRSVKPGMFLLKGDMTNTEAINMLRSGDQVPVKLTFSTARKIDEMPGKIAAFMAFDSVEMQKIMLDTSVIESYGFRPETFISMFIPNTYEVYWTETPRQILDRMKNEYDKYWNETRRKKALSIGMTPSEIVTLASIVDWETNQMDEAPIIAGAYINRLREGMKLQADPTVVFGIGDFTIQRVLLEQIRYDSPYNTYMYKGLPPGPINMPSIAAVEAVLNYDRNDYLYFCAKPDFSGYHLFAKTLGEHNVNARALHRALNKQKIFR